ncbi:hypothetical protein [Prevotella sp.]|uniref:hypothetical protein n=1 Tax=Prevotella sp. TaxID=59823 RepID=UPI003DA3B988
MDNKLSEEEMRVINNVVDKKIEKVMDEFLIEKDKLDKRVSNLEKESKAIFQELNFYIDDSKESMFKENLNILWKKENYVTWVDDLDNIRHISINKRYGSLKHIFTLIISCIDLIYIHHEKLKVQLKRDLAIILGFNADDYKSYQAFKNAYYNAIDSIDK